MRLIDADAAKLALIGWDTDPTDEEIEYTIDNIPTIDAVPVVRCKDCFHFELIHERQNQGVCTINTDGYIYMRCDDFCNYGERKTDGEVTKVL